MCSLPPNRFLLHFSTFDKEIRSPLERHLSRVYRIVFLEFLQEKKIHKERKKEKSRPLADSYCRRRRRPCRPCRRRRRRNFFSLFIFIYFTFFFTFHCRSSLS